jgi:hypothetical protein
MKMRVFNIKCQKNQKNQQKKSKFSAKKSKFQRKSLLKKLKNPEKKRTFSCEKGEIRPFPDEISGKIGEISPEFRISGTNF